MHTIYCIYLTCVYIHHIYIYIYIYIIGKVVRCLWTPSPEKHEACGSETRIVAVKVQYKLRYILYAYVFAFGKNA